MFPTLNTESSSLLRLDSDLAAPRLAYKGWARSEIRLAYRGCGCVEVSGCVEVTDDDIAE